MRYDTIKFNKRQYNTVQSSPVQCSLCYAMPHHTIPYNARHNIQLQNRFSNSVECRTGKTFRSTFVFNAESNVGLVQHLVVISKTNIQFEQVLYSFLARYSIVTIKTKAQIWAGPVFVSSSVFTDNCRIHTVFDQHNKDECITRLVLSLINIDIPPHNHPDMATTTLMRANV